MATNPASTDDLSARSLRTLSSQELTVGQALLADAWQIIINEVPTVSGRLDADASFAPLVVSVECAMVLRVLNNPSGKLEESVDDYTYRRDASTSTGSLYLSDTERELLGRGDTSYGAFTIRQSAVPFASYPPGWELFR